MYLEIKGGLLSSIMELHLSLVEEQEKASIVNYSSDEHWSWAFYRGLNELQYADGIDMVNMNRDDATGFRLDTLATCKQYSTPVVRGQEKSLQREPTM